MRRLHVSQFADVVCSSAPVLPVPPMPKQPEPARPLPETLPPPVPMDEPPNGVPGIELPAP